MIKSAVQYSISKEDSLVIKGLAILLMLWHHLFYEYPVSPIVDNVAFFAKVCVSLFLFISGYGLTVNYVGSVLHTQSKMTNTIRFLLKRFLKFFYHYWIVFVIFIPIGVFLFGRTLSDAYGKSNVYQYLILDFLGVAGFSSYNITWWFNQLIICLYLLFPLLIWLIRKIPLITLIVFLSFVKIHYFIIPVIHDWLFVFSLGITYGLYMDKINTLFSKINKNGLSIIFFLFFIFFLLLRFGVIKHWSGIKADGFLSYCIIMLVILVFKNIQIITIPLIYLGKHSMNMYMIHTFIYLYWMKDLIYSFKYPLLIFIGLLAISLMLSIFIENLKSRTGLNKVLNSLEKKIVYSK